jgi:hypothetical protein
MMEERPAPAAIVWIIRLVQGGEPGGVLGAMILAAAFALFAMMAIGMLVAWQTGLGS